MVGVQTDFVATIDEQTCNCSRGDCCRKCLHVCSTGALIWVAGDRDILIDPWECDGCGNCVTACPQGAISMLPRRHR